jgi:NTP pyrophosphatase (non-canonical NTP hydrolase)
MSRYPRPPFRGLADLPDAAQLLLQHLAGNAHHDPGKVMQTLAVAEEAGEFVGAWRRYVGLARRRGSLDEVRAELADVLIVSVVCAQYLNLHVEAGLRDDPVPTHLDDTNQVVLDVFVQAGLFVETTLELPAVSRRELAKRLMMVILAARAAATALRIDLVAAIDAKLEHVFDRGWREPAATHA